MCTGCQVLFIHIEAEGGAMYQHMQIYHVHLIPVKLFSMCQVFSTAGHREDSFYERKDWPLASVMEQSRRFEG